MIINKSNIGTISLILLLTSFLNPVLRPGFDNVLTVFRILMPVMLMLLVISWKYKISYFLLIIGSFIFYCLFLGVTYNITVLNVMWLINYIYAFCTIYLVYLVFVSKEKDFDKSFYSFMYKVYLFVWFNILLNYFGFQYPTLPAPESEVTVNPLRAFFSNQNDMAVYLVFMIVLLLHYESKIIPKILFTLMSLYVCYYNDSKIGFISIMMVVFAYMYLHVAKNIKSGFIRLLLTFTVTLFSIYIFVLILNSQIELIFNSGDFTIQDLFLVPFNMIINLDPSGVYWGGSIFNRADAIIYVLIEYLKTHGLGLGPGGSVYVLSLPEYELGGAKSPHNFVLQLLVEFGYPILILYLYLIYEWFRRFMKRNISQADSIFIVSIFIVPFIGMSQSGSIMQNYLFISVFTYIFFTAFHNSNEIQGSDNETQLT